MLRKLYQREARLDNLSCDLGKWWIIFDNHEKYSVNSKQQKIDKFYIIIILPIGYIFLIMNRLFYDSV